MSNPESMSPDDIQKFVDGRLSPDQQVRLEAWLADHPEDAALVHAYRLQNTSLSRTFDPVSDEPVPTVLIMISSRCAPPPSNSRRRPQWQVKSPAGCASRRR